MKDWEKIEKSAEAFHTNTTKYLSKMILEKQPIFYDMKDLAPMLNGMRIISSNINQIARKANETNSVFAGDVEKLKTEVTELFHTVNTSFSTVLLTKV